MRPPSALQLSLISVPAQDLRNHLHHPTPTPGKDFDELQHEGKEVTKLKEQLRCFWLTLRVGRLCWTAQRGRASSTLRKSEPIDLARVLVCSVWPTTRYAPEGIGITCPFEGGGINGHKNDSSWNLRYRIMDVSRKEAVQPISLPGHYCFRK